ncbi:MAG: hypothetical protein Q8S84_09625 [bacterium]|nr:hypothetical protein [bacterium]MDP3381672.1 hypothetical protein [bacterium]
MIISLSVILFSSYSTIALLFQKFTFDVIIFGLSDRFDSIILEQLEQCIQEIFNFVFFIFLKFIY